MDILYALGYELYPQNKNFFESQFAAKEKEYKEFIRSKIEEGYFENYMFFKLNRSDFERFFIPYAVLSHMKADDLKIFVNKQRGSQKVIDDFKNNASTSIYYEAVNNTPYKLDEEREIVAFDEFSKLTGLKWGKKSNSISIEKVLKSFFESLSFKEGETNSYFRANYLAIYQMDVIKFSGNLTRDEWLSIYSAVTNNQFFIKERLPSEFLLQSELINYCINKSIQEDKYEKDVENFLSYDDTNDILVETEKNSKEIIQSLTKQVKGLEENLLLCKKEIHLLNEHINLSKSTIKKTDDVITEQEPTLEELKGKEVELIPFPKKVVYFGGHPNLHRKINAIHPNWKFFDPDNYTGSNIISNADLIILDKKYNNHGQSKRLASLISRDTRLITVKEATNEHIILDDAFKKWNRL